MLKILKYSFFDVLRSRWMILYFLFFFLSAVILLNFTSDLPKAVGSLMNLTITIVPLISTVFGVMYYYSSKDFAELLLCQPIKRSQVFLGQYLGLSISLVISFMAGTSIPFAMYGAFVSDYIWDYGILVICGVMLSFIFTALAYYISILNEDRIKGFGIAILVWLILSVVYDGLLLYVFVIFNEYPLENAAVVLTMINPVDLSRVMILLKLDISAMMGYTGAVFQQVFGSFNGILLSFFMLVIWAALPVLAFVRRAKRKDF
ncbi:MAG: ABC transporter permease subunit [Crocinitomicaceae bacterium]|nr:ABC transporter permease subunit [Crocinitomicaceae bacterium]MBK8926491.1 ABC transporter permease subunit [Crocinitomicaceae bacterium]